MCGVALGCLLAAGCSMANGRLGPPGRGKGQAWTPIRRKKTLMCRLAVPVGCRMKHAKGMFQRWLLRAGKWPWKARKEKFHTCGGPRRRPCLGQGRGRRISQGRLHGKKFLCGLCSNAHRTMTQPGRLSGRDAKLFLGRNLRFFPGFAR